jgi:hypothetical protein
MLLSILQAATADASTGDDATLALLGLLSAGRSFEILLERAAPPVGAHEEAVPSDGPMDSPTALALGILAFHRHMTAKLDGLIGEVAEAPEPPQPTPRPSLPRGLLR